ncbi:MAG: xanthine dehydrogenase family protein subunit M, partial [SAR324 cluster bacterium]|nr:xanthine dehydrogenase family protein subunit M [SAR324 cluster bacterium]
GKKPDENMLAEAGRLAAADSEPMEDLRGSAEYKRALVNELTQRAIKLSLQRAEGSR